jgi:hypothetical protein
MRVLVLSAVLCAWLAAGAPSPVRAAPTPVSELAHAPPDAQRFTILSTAGRHGESTRWTDTQGQHWGRESILLRGQVFEVDDTARLGADGMLEQVVVRGFTPNGDAAERFSIVDGQARWTSPVDKGSATYHGPAEYVAFGGPMDLTADLIERLLASPQRTVALLPGGEAHAEPLTTLVVGTAGSRKTVTAYAVTGITNTPVPVWVDERGRFFALVQAIAWMMRSRSARPHCSGRCATHLPDRSPSRTCERSSTERAS